MVHLANLVQLGLFGPICTILSNSIYSVQFGPYDPPRFVQSNLANSVYSVQFGPYGPLSFIWSS